MSLYSTVSLIFLLFLITDLAQSFDQKESVKNWESVCSILSCKTVLDKCIQNACLGADQCRSCVQTQNQNCLRCLDSIINEQYFTINGAQTIICDSLNSLHSTTCNCYCRMNESENWKCEQIGGYPLCNCYGSTSTTTLSTTASTASTTTTSTASSTTTSTASTTTTSIPSTTTTNIYQTELLSKT